MPFHPVDLVDKLIHLIVGADGRLLPMQCADRSGKAMEDPAEVTRFGGGDEHGHDHRRQHSGWKGDRFPQEFPPPGGIGGGGGGVFRGRGCRRKTHLLAAFPQDDYLLTCDEPPQ